jgi:hypothetical protein
VGTDDVPPYPDGAVIARGRFPRGYSPDDPQTVPDGATAAAAASISLTHFPAPGLTTAIAGSVQGLAIPENTKALLYVGRVSDAAGSLFAWWSHPYAQTSARVGPDGAFSFPDWASDPAHDADSLAFQILVIPKTTAIVDGACRSACMSAVMRAVSYACCACVCASACLGVRVFVPCALSRVFDGACLVVPAWV